MASRATTVALVAVGAVLALAAPATAATFCVPSTGPGCSGTSEPTIDDALNAAAGNNSPSPTKDTIRIAAGTYHGPFHEAFDNPVSMIGAGPATVIDNPATGAASLQMDDDDSDVASLKVLPRKGSNQPAVQAHGTLTRITVTEEAGDSGALGVSLASGTLDQSTVTMPDPTSMGVTGAGGTVTRSRITAGATGIRDYASVVADDDVVRVTQANSVAIDRGLNEFGGTLTAHQDTLIGPAGAAGSTGVHLGAGFPIAGFGGGNASADVDGVVIRGFATDLSADGVSSFCGINSDPCDFTADIDVRYSDFSTAREHKGQDASINHQSGNLPDVDPRFRNPAAGDFGLRVGSPLVDRGNPAAPAAGEPALDAAGVQRKIDGDRNGSAIVDIGAFELPKPRAPVARFRGPRFALVGKPAHFDGTGSGNPNGGGPLKFRWHFQHDGNATGAKPAHTFEATGKYSVQLVVIDAFGFASTPALERVPVFEKPPCLVPKLRGKTVDSAEAALERKHCKLGVVSHRHASSVAKGRVISSKPPAGAVVKRGTRVALVVSSG